MKVLSNAEFDQLAKAGKSSRLKVIARERHVSDPNGVVKIEDLSSMINISGCMGDKIAISWLKNLHQLAKSGKLRTIRKGATNWEAHKLHVDALYVRKAIKFNITDAVMLKDSGKYGQIVDYLPEEKKYLVVLDPFQTVMEDGSNLEKVTASRKKAGELDDDTYKSRLPGWDMDPQILSKEEAENIVEQLQQPGDDWIYTIVPAKAPGRYMIDITDETGTFVAYWTGK